jgi:hypothetical protein
MRFLPTFIALLCLGCTKHPTAEEKALISAVEDVVTLPKGGGKVACYGRHYALLESKEADEYLGIPLARLAGRQLLVGEYRRGERPGVYWAKSSKDLPQAIYDGGCDNMQIIHIVGDPVREIVASCSTDIGGDIPNEIDPAVTC